MTFTEVFGGTTIYPSGVSYRAVALSANQTLAWPVETATNGNVVAQIMDVTPSVGSLSIFMPPANEASVGETVLFFNPGAFTFTIKDTGGNTIVAVAPGLSYQVYLIGNSTPNGTWRSTQYAAGTSVATAGSLVGAGIKAISTTLNQSMSVTTLNSNYSIGDADRSEAFVWTGGAGAFTLPSSGTVGNDWFCHIRNSGTGAITLTPTGIETINGAPNLTFNPGDSAIVICDGSAFFTIGFGQSVAFAFDYVSIDLSSPVTSPYTLSGANLNRIAYSFGGTLTTNMQVLIPATIQQYWISNDTSGAFTLTVKVAGQLGVVVPQGARGIYYCNGTDIIDADTASFAFPVTVAQGGTGATTESGARINLGGTSVGIGVFTATTAADGRVALSAAKSGANSDITSLTGLTTPLSVPQGGTGAATLTANGVLYGSGASAIAATAVGTTGQVLVGNTGAAPSWATLTGIGVTSFSAGTTGFTPSTATTGAITLAGTLGVANGGTGTTTAFTAGSVVFAGASGVYTQDNANFFWDNANDRLGIGINTPAIKLQVSDVDQATARIGVRNANGQNYHLVAGTPGASNTGFAIFDATASATRMYITSAGVVGIGTTSPLAGFRLDVSGSANASGSFISGGGTTNQAQIGNKVLLFYNTSVGEGLIQSADDASTFNSMGIDKTTLRFLTNNTERARITSTGGLAVGTTTDPGAGNIGLAAGKFLQFSSTAYMTPEDNVAGARIVTPGAFNLATGGTAVRMTVDGSGSVGIGVAPSAWGGSTPAIQILRASLWGAANNSYQGSNYYYDGSDRRYIGSDFAAEYAQLTGNHLWYTAASGTAGNVISFSERMRITPDGNVGIGTSSPFTRLEVNSGTGTAPVLSVYATNPAFGAEDVLGTIGFGSNGSGNNIQAASISGVNETASSSTNGILRFSTRTAASVTEKMRLTSAGNLLVGTTSTELGGSFKNVILEGGDGGIFQVQTPSAAQKMAISVDSSAGYVGTRTNNPLVFNTNNTERMRITSAGNVGIGTTTPVTRLHVSQSNSGDYASVALLSNSADAAADRTGIYGSPAPGTANPYRGGITFWPGSSGAVSIHTGNNATPGAGERMRIDGSGNVGVGVTPSAWSGYGPPVIQLQNNGTMVASGSSLYLGANWYYSGGNFLYNTTDFATYYQQISGQHRFFNAPSGTVGNAITFTQAMTLDASGNLLVGNTTPFYNNAGRGLINVNGSSQSFIGFGIAGAGKGYLACVSNTFAMESENGLDIKLNAIGSNTVQMWTNNTERARIDGSGNLLVGTTTASALGTQSKFRTSGNGGGANASIGTVSGAGTGAVDTLIPINQSSFGGTALLLASRNTSDGLNTLSAVYLVTFYFDGNNAPAKTLIAGTDFVTFGVSGSQTLTLTNAGGGNVTYAWFGNK